MRTMLANVSLVALIICSPLAAQTQFTGGTLTHRPASAGVASAIAATSGSSWVAWSVPGRGSFRTCCGAHGWSGASEHCGTCTLSDDASNFSSRDDERAASAPILIAIRTGATGLNQIRLFSSSCTIDAKHESVVWLDDVKPADSIAWLRSKVTDGASHLSRHATMAIALHDDPSAVAALHELATSKYPDETRGDALFWLAQTHGHEGFVLAKSIVHSDASDRLKEKAVFALHESNDPAAVDELIDEARHNASTEVRSKALFWLSQRAGAKAVAALRDAVENDPEETIKTHAVFAISQLPDDESIPMLLELARTNRHAAVRKKAVFWLGQKSDPRAIEAIAAILR